MNTINDYTNYLREKYGERVQKITVLGGFSCPNRDGKKSTGGCIYCNNSSFSPIKLGAMPLREQIEHGITQSKFRYKKVKKYIIYFQSYSNTYAPLEVLKEKYEAALERDDVVGLSIGTRPDCVDAEKLDYIASLNEHHDITLEYGIESVFDESLEKLNRCCDFATCQKAIEETAKRGIPVCGHIIIGLPWETKEQMFVTAKKISELPLHSLKIHQLHVVKNTKLGEMYLDQPFHTLTKEEYAEWLEVLIENLRPDLYIQRLMGEAPSHLLLSPEWDIKPPEFAAEFKKRLESKNSYQGINYNS